MTESIYFQKFPYIHNESIKNQYKKSTWFNANHPNVVSFSLLTLNHPWNLHINWVFHIIYLHTLKQPGLDWIFWGLPGVPSFSPTSRCNAIALIWSCTGGSFVGLRRVRGALDGSWMPEDGWLGSGGGWWVVWVKRLFLSWTWKNDRDFFR